MAIDVISELDDGQVEDLLEMFRHEWWTEGRERDSIRRILRESDVVVGLRDGETGKLVGFARVLSDYVYKALVLDVIVAASHRDRGLGRELMDAVMGHPALRHVRDFELYCRPEMVPFYQRWGFRDDLDGLCFMRRTRRQTP